MKPIYLSRHARRRMRLHRITSEEIEDVLASPDNVEPTLNDRNNATKATSDRIIRVTFIEEPNRIVVATVTPRRRI